MKTPKILIIGPTHYILGGVAVWLSYIVRGLESKGFDVTFGALHGMFHDSDAYLAAYPFKQVVKIDCDVGNDHAKHKAILGAIEAVLPDIVLVVNAADVYPAIRKIRRNIRHKFRVVPTLHGVVPTLFDDMRTYRDVIDDIVVTNRLTQKMVQQFAEYESDQVHYAQYGVCADPNAGIFTEKNDVCQILYCGRIDNDQKRCQDLPKLCSELLKVQFPFKLLIVGDGPTRDELLDSLDQICSEAGTGRFYEYIPSVPVEQINEIAYSRADVLFLPSLWETGPIVAWEAMSQGVPLVTSNYIGSKSEEALSHDKNCLMFDIGNISLAAQLIIESQDSRNRHRLIEGGLELVTQRYSRTASIDAWANVLNRIHQNQTRSGVSKFDDSKTKVVEGRLERYFGQRVATTIRKIMGKPTLMKSAGDEWPHTHSQLSIDEIREFDRLLVNLENGSD